MNSKKVPIQIMETNPAVMKQFCKPMPEYQGVIAKLRANPMVLRITITDAIDSPPICGKQSIAYAIAIEPPTTSPKTSIPKPNASPAQWMP
jgi:hypothetical protein